MPAAVHLVLRDADPSGIVIATRDNWTGKAYGLPVGDLQYLLPALSGAGVYILVGEDENAKDDLPVIYIGEAEDITSRLRPNHAQLSRGDIEWRRVVVFASQSDDLHKAHVRWLEAELVRRAKMASRCHLTNGNTPPSPRLPEFDEVFVQAFLDNMLVLYPLLGIDIFAPPRASRRQLAADVLVGELVQEEMDPIRSTVLVLRVAGEVRARARVEADKRLTILEGSSIARRGQESESRKAAATRQLLVDNGNAAERDQDWWALTTDHGPLSPSAAGVLVLGYSVNGRVIWQTDGGVTYADLAL
jgi:hypothetical protein